MVSHFYGMLSLACQSIWVPVKRSDTYRCVIPHENKLYRFNKWRFSKFQRTSTKSTEGFFFRASDGHTVPPPRHVYSVSKFTVGPVVFRERSSTHRPWFTSKLAKFRRALSEWDESWQRWERPQFPLCTQPGAVANRREDVPLTFLGPSKMRPGAKIEFPTGGETCIDKTWTDLVVGKAWIQLFARRPMFGIQATTDAKYICVDALGR
jgi:hypothetical protein